MRPWIGAILLPLLAAGPGTVDPLSVAAGRQPSVAVDADGGVFVAFVAGGRIQVAARPKDATAFATTAVADGREAACGMRRGPRIAAAAGSLVVSWIDNRSRDLVAARSADGGRTWSPPAPVNRRRGACGEGLHALAAGTGKALFAAWLQAAEEGKGGTVIRFTRSEDGGATWTGECTAYASPSGSVCECCHPSVAVSPGGEVAVMFRNSLEGARDLFVVRSADGGKTFGKALRLGRGTWPLKACPMDGGGLAFGSKGALFTAWRRASTVFLTGTAEAEVEGGPGEQPWVGGVPGGAAWAAWTDGAGDLLVQPFEGADRAPRRLPAGGARCAYPVVAGSSSGVVFAAWERVPGGKEPIRIEGAFLK